MLGSAKRFPSPEHYDEQEERREKKGGFSFKTMCYILVVQVRVDELEETEEDMSRDYLSFPKRDAPSSKRGSVKASDTTTRIYACATMWHETEDEMLEMLKSIFR